MFAPFLCPLAIRCITVTAYLLRIAGQLIVPGHHEW